MEGEIFERQTLFEKKINEKQIELESKLDQILDMLEHGVDDQQGKVRKKLPVENQPGDVGNSRISTSKQLKDCQSFQVVEVNSDGKLVLVFTFFCCV